MSQISTDDSTLAGNSSDPSTWVESYGDYLYRYALLRVRNTAQAEDLVQETLLAALQARHNFAGQSSEKTWLIGILKHKVIDHYRKYRREKVVDTTDSDEDAVNKFFNEQHGWKSGMEPVEWPNPTKDIESSEFIQTLKRCLSDLSERAATVFTMREMDGLSSEEICETLDISQNNFWVIMHRARLTLRRCLELRWFRKDTDN